MANLEEIVSVSTSTKAPEKTSRDIFLSGVAGLLGGLLGVPMSIGSYLLWRKLGLKGSLRWWAWAATGIVGVPLSLAITKVIVSPNDQTPVSSTSAVSQPKDDGLGGGSENKPQKVRPPTKQKVDAPSPVIRNSDKPVSATESDRPFYTNEGFIGAFTEEDLGEAIGFAVDNDKTALEKFVLEGRAFVIPPGKEVKSRACAGGFGCPTRKVRIAGATRYFYTVPNALSQSNESRAEPTESSQASPNPKISQSDGSKAEPNPSGFNAEIFSPPTNCRSGPGKNNSVIKVFSRGDVLVDQKNSQADAQGSTWFKELYANCWVNESQLKFK
jgi:hypothetical protein